jgi:hypothetical protein
VVFYFRAPTELLSLDVVPKLTRRVEVTSAEGLDSHVFLCLSQMKNVNA